MTTDGWLFTVYCDGGARGNPGEAALGLVVYDESRKLLVAKGKPIGVATNNVAEYKAVIEGLTWLLGKIKTEGARVRFFLDSQLVVNQLNGVFKVKEARLRELVVQAKILEGELREREGVEVHYRFVPRHKNFLADKLVNLALDRQTQASLI